MKELNIKKLQTATSPKKNKNLLVIGGAVALILIGTVFFFAHQSVLSMHSSLEQNSKKIQKELVRTRIKTTEDWLNDGLRKGTQLTNSEFFQLFASEVNKLDGLPMLFKSDDAGIDSNEPSARLPLITNQLIEFVNYTNFESGRIVNGKGEMYLSSMASLVPLSTEQLKLVETVTSTGRFALGPVYKSRNGFALEYFLPIYPMVYENKNGKPVSVLILTQLVGNSLSAVLRQDLTENDPHLILVQSTPAGYQAVIPEGIQIKPLEIDDIEETLAESRRPSLTREEDVHSYGQRLNITNWWIVAEENSATLLSRLQEFSKTAYTLAALASLTLLLTISAGWWWLVGRERGAINNQFRELIALIDNQKRLLDGINNTMSDPISLTDTNGVYQYTNKAFGLVVGRPEGDITGLDMPAVLGFDTAKRLNLSDQHVLMMGEPTQIQDTLWLQSKRFVFQILKSPLKTDGKVTGVVSVYRDVTQLIETQERSRRAVQQTIDALVSTIEQADPFLGGHSRIMGSVAGLVAQQLRFADTDIATIEAAATLSQIGKMYVPRDILLKPGALTPNEKQLMEQHVDHARKLLQNIEFDLPVLDVICQINERLDGNGYPDKLAADQISIHAKVLAVANAFTAMARPRAYRPAMPVDQVVSILSEQVGAYDQVVVEALKEVLLTPNGERLVKEASIAKAD